MKGLGLKLVVEKSGVEMSFNLKNSRLKSPGLESSWLKNIGLKGQGLKLGVEKSGVEMSFNRKDISFKSQLPSLLH